MKNGRGTMQKMNVKERVKKFKIGRIKKECEEIWAKNKYYVLSKSHKIYLEIREYLKKYPNKYLQESTLLTGENI